jgi:hypothetical protein
MSAVPLCIFMETPNLRKVCFLSFRAAAVPLNFGFIQLKLVVLQELSDDRTNDVTNSRRLGD